MEELKIDDQFKSLIPPISFDESQDLEASIKKDGCRDSLVTWRGYILDGHNRYRICQMYGIEFKTTEMLFSDRDEAKIWIIKNQLGRRNLTPDQMKYLRGRQYEIEKGVQGKKTQNGTFSNTAKRLAKQHGVSKNTILRDAAFAKKIDAMPEEERESVLSGSGNVDEEINKIVTAHVDNLEEAGKDLADAVKRSPEPKESSALVHLKTCWKQCNKTDRKRFMKWAKLTTI